MPLTNLQSDILKLLASQRDPESFLAGFTPEGLIAEIRRNSRYPAADWKSIVAAEPIDATSVLSRLRTALDKAEVFVAKMPTSKAGLLFLKEGNAVQPDPEHLENYQTHAGQRRGHWPSSPDLSSAMFERKDPNNQ